VTTPAPRIHILPEAVAGRIAAGEVVENPASVVKELVENALDAGATAISVEVRDGGLSLIRVNDNGTGISRAEAPLALARFATSKIHSIEDLTAIRTLGFRGEALPSIAAVSHVEVLTRAQDEIEGTRLRAEGDRISVEPAASPVGCSVTVRDLFYNAPARRKFMKSPLRERERIHETLIRYALIYPNVAFRFVADGRELLAAPPASPLERLGALLGRDVAGEMLPIHWEALDLRVSGFISRPTLGRASRAEQFYAVNGRPIRGGLLVVALERPYAGRLPPGRYPLASVHIEIAPHLMDVNVHPRKAEVRFLQERSVYWALSQAVEAALSPYPRQGQALVDFAWPFAEAAAPAALHEPATPYQAGALRPIGQMHSSYILAQSAEGLVVVDQHAAHEQVLFERLLRQAQPQPLTPPARLTLTPREADALMENLEAFLGLGMEVEPFGGNTFLLRSLPDALAGRDPQALITALLSELDRYRNVGLDELREKLAMKAACTAAVKAGEPLTPDQMAALLRDLGEAWSPATCPHGRPAFITLTLEELERRFLRR
jgi:DNA mismatch repair protein MutL